MKYCLRGISVLIVKTKISRREGEKNHLQKGLHILYSSGVHLGQKIPQRRASIFTPVLLPEFPIEEESSVHGGAKSWTILATVHHHNKPLRRRGSVQFSSNVSDSRNPMNCKARQASLNLSSLQSSRPSIVFNLPVYLDTGRGEGVGSFLCGKRLLSALFHLRWGEKT